LHRLPAGSSGYRQRILEREIDYGFRPENDLLAFADR
jgi:hypothetical protein